MRFPDPAPGLRPRHASGEAGAVCVLGVTKDIAARLRGALTSAGLTSAFFPSAAALARARPGPAVVLAQIGARSDLSSVLRAAGRAPVLALIAAGEARPVERGVSCLECGADDFVLSTSGDSVLVARVKAALRRRFATAPEAEAPEGRPRPRPAVGGAGPASGTGEFHAMLRRLRVECGFPSAYAFYFRNGGRAAFPFTYQYYARVEKGGALMRPDQLRSIVYFLRLNYADPRARELLLAYLRSWVGGAEVSRWLLDPLLRVERLAPARRSLARWLQRERSFHLSPAQLRAVLSSEAAYWCFEFLFSDRGAWTASALASELGLPAPKVAAALGSLRRCGLLRRTAGGKYRNPRAGMLYSFPPHPRLPSESSRRLSGYWDAMARRRGETLLMRVALVRAESADVHALFPRLLEAVDAANPASIFEKGERSAFFTVEARVRRLFDA